MRWFPPNIPAPQWSRSTWDWTAILPAWLKPDTPVKGLFLTGADAGSLGIVGALMGGVSAAARIVGPSGLFPIIAAATRAKMKASARHS
jgi:hypothetical protein